MGEKYVTMKRNDYKKILWLVGQLNKAVDNVTTQIGEDELGLNDEPQTGEDDKTRLEWRAEIKRYMAEKRVKGYEVASALGISSAVLSTKLRKADGRLYREIVAVVDTIVDMEGEDDSVCL